MYKTFLSSLLLAAATTTISGVLSAPVDTPPPPPPSTCGTDSAPAEGLEVCKQWLDADDGFLKAPVNMDDPKPPEGHEHYISPCGSKFNMHDFNTWWKGKLTAAEEAKLPKPKYFKVEPGKYTAWVDESADGYNQVIEMDGLRGEDNEDFIFDFRGVTFCYPAIVKETEGNPASAVYIGQCNKLTILGGTIWIYPGKELFSQALIKAMDNTDPKNKAINTVTFAVEDGYDMEPWKTVDYRWTVVDARNPDHYERIDMTDHLWGYVDEQKVDTDARTATANFNAVGFEVGMHALVSTGIELQPVAISAEMSSDLKVIGLTTNGRFDQYGLHGHQLEGVINKPESWIDCMVTNPPLTKGLAPRILGPTLVQWYGGEILLPMMVFDAENLG